MKSESKCKVYKANYSLEEKEFDYNSIANYHCDNCLLLLGNFDDDSLYNEKNDKWYCAKCGELIEKLIERRKGNYNTIILL